MAATITAGTMEVTTAAIINDVTNTRCKLTDRCMWQLKLTAQLLPTITKLCI